MQELSNAVAALRTSSSRLNGLTDDIAQLIGAVEDFLNEECSIGIETSVTMKEGEDPPEYWHDTLEYTRHGNRYRIVVRHYYTFAGDGNDVAKPWAECSRKDKLDSAALLPDLLIAIAKQVDEKIEIAQGAKAAIENLIAEGVTLEGE